MDVSQIPFSDNPSKQTLFDKNWEEKVSKKFINSINDLINAAQAEKKRQINSGSGAYKTFNNLSEICQSICEKNIRNIEKEEILLAEFLTDRATNYCSTAESGNTIRRFARLMEDQELGKDLTKLRSLNISLNTTIKEKLGEVRKQLFSDPISSSSDFSKSLVMLSQSKIKAEVIVIPDTPPQEPETNTNSDQSLEVFDASKVKKIMSEWKDDMKKISGHLDNYLKTLQNVIEALNKKIKNLKEKGEPFQQEENNLKEWENQEKTALQAQNIEKAEDIQRFAEILTPNCQAPHCPDKGSVLLTTVVKDFVPCILSLYNIYFYTKKVYDQNSASKRAQFYKQIENTEVGKKLDSLAKNLASLEIPRDATKEEQQKILQNVLFVDALKSSSKKKHGRKVSFGNEEHFYQHEYSSPPNKSGGTSISGNSREIDVDSQGKKDQAKSRTENLPQKQEPALELSQLVAQSQVKQEENFSRFKPLVSKVDSGEIESFIKEIGTIEREYQGSKHSNLFQEAQEMLIEMMKFLKEVKITNDDKIRNDYIFWFLNKCAEFYSYTNWQECNNAHLIKKISNYIEECIKSVDQSLTWEDLFKVTTVPEKLQSNLTKALAYFERSLGPALPSSVTDSKEPLKTSKEDLRSFTQEFQNYLKTPQVTREIIYRCLDEFNEKLAKYYHQELIEKERFNSMVEAENFIHERKPLHHIINFCKNIYYFFNFLTLHEEEQRFSMETKDLRTTPTIDKYLEKYNDLLNTLQQNIENQLEMVSTIAEEISAGNKRFFENKCKEQAKRLEKNIKDFSLKKNNNEDTSAVAEEILVDCIALVKATRLPKSPLYETVQPLRNHVESCLQRRVTAVRRSLDPSNAGDPSALSGVNLSDNRCRISGDLFQVLSDIEKPRSMHLRFLWSLLEDFKQRVNDKIQTLPENQRWTQNWSYFPKDSQVMQFFLQEEQKWKDTKDYLESLSASIKEEQSQPDDNNNKNNVNKALDDFIDNAKIDYAGYISISPFIKIRSYLRFLDHVLKMDEIRLSSQTNDDSVSDMSIDNVLLPTKDVIPRNAKKKQNMPHSEVQTSTSSYSASKSSRNSKFTNYSSEALIPQLSNYLMVNNWKNMSNKELSSDAYSPSRPTEDPLEETYFMSDNKIQLHKEIAILYEDAYKAFSQMREKIFIDVFDSLHEKIADLETSKNKKQKEIDQIKYLEDIIGKLADVATTISAKDVDIIKSLSTAKYIIDAFAPYENAYRSSRGEFYCLFRETIGEDALKRLKEIKPAIPPEPRSADAQKAVSSPLELSQMIEECRSLSYQHIKWLPWVINAKKVELLAAELSNFKIEDIKSWKTIMKNIDNLLRSVKTAQKFRNYIGKNDPHVYQAIESCEQLYRWGKIKADDHPGKKLADYFEERIKSMGKDVELLSKVPGIPESLRQDLSSNLITLSKTISWMFLDCQKISESIKDITSYIQEFQIYVAIAGRVKKAALYAFSDVFFEKLTNLYQQYLVAKRDSEPQLNAKEFFIKKGQPFQQLLQTLNDLGCPFPQQKPQAEMIQIGDSRLGITMDTTHSTSPQVKTGLTRDISPVNVNNVNAGEIDNLVFSLVVSPSPDKVQEKPITPMGPPLARQFSEQSIQGAQSSGTSNEKVGNWLPKLPSPNQMPNPNLLSPTMERRPSSTSSDRSSAGSKRPFDNISTTGSLTNKLGNIGINSQSSVGDGDIVMGGTQTDSQKKIYLQVIKEETVKRINNTIKALRLIPKRPDDVEDFIDSLETVQRKLLKEKLTPKQTGEAIKKLEEIINTCPSPDLEGYRGVAAGILEIEKLENLKKLLEEELQSKKQRIE